MSVTGCSTLSHGSKLLKTPNANTSEDRAFTSADDYGRTPWIVALLDETPIPADAKAICPPSRSIHSE